jgi:hypothetical protein
MKIHLENGRGWANRQRDGENLGTGVRSRGQPRGCGVANGKVLIQPRRVHHNKQRRSHQLRPARAS